MEWNIKTIGFLGIVVAYLIFEIWAWTQGSVPFLEYTLVSFSIIVGVAWAVYGIRKYVFGEERNFLEGLFD